MTDRPIIFSAPMIRALLDGRKTQTRRIVAQPDTDGGERWVKYPDGWVLAVNDDDEWRARVTYAPGDRLWVREAIDNVSQPGAVFYRVDYDAQINGGSDRLGWIPSIHMPRWASRITLIVTGVRVERLQDIIAEDVQAEGACELAVVPPNDEDTREARALFRDLWNSLHGPDAWDANPWVVALTFDVARGNIDQIGGAG